MPVKTTTSEVIYPVEIHLKVIMFSDAGDEKNISDLNLILEKFSIPLKKDWTVSKSSAGNYRCYTGKVYIESKELMYALFAELNQHPNVKFAI
ncbi:MAG TPA: DUF493 family protein [bacterium]|nr:DUF493 family protein [bacterium]HPS30698.1 DUF493 family protein [bacterium]